MSFGALVHAEWVKTRTRPLSRGLLAGLLGLAVVPAIFTAGSLLNDSGAKTARDLLALPSAFLLAVSIMTLLTPPLTLLLVSTSVGSEYAHDTWKSVLPRQPGRARFLVAKLFVEAVAFALAICAVLAVFLAIDKGCVRLLGPGKNPQAPWDPAALGLSAAYICVVFALNASVAVLATVVSRSTVVGIFAGWLGLPLLSMASYSTKALTTILPGPRVDHLQALWVEHQPARAITQAFGREVPAAESVLVILAFALCCLAAAAAIFKRRDIS